MRLQYTDNTCSILQGDVVIGPKIVDPTAITQPYERCQTVQWNDGPKRVSSLGLPRDEVTRMRDFRYDTRVNGGSVEGCDRESVGETRISFASPLAVQSSLQLCALDGPYGSERALCQNRCPSIFPWNR